MKNDGMSKETRQFDSDAHTLQQLGYTQELARRLGSFSNLAISLSIICILAGGITSFHLGFCAAGGASIGLGWPLVCAFSTVVALSMGQIASAFPTAGGLYHWASILGGRGWGWGTAWFNLIGLVTVLAAINVGTYEFFVQAFGLSWQDSPHGWWIQLSALTLITLTQAAFNHAGIRVTALLTDFSGYWILATATALVAALLSFGATHDLSRLWTFSNFTGIPDGRVWPAHGSIGVAFALGWLLPAYTITGFDASAHVAEETVSASRNVPSGIVRSVVLSGITGWIMLATIVMAMPSLEEAALQGPTVFYWVMRTMVPAGVRLPLFAAILIAQYLCGLATVTSASRMAFAFARDGGLPYRFRKISPRYRSPAVAIWGVASAAILFTVYSPVYSTITAVCTIFLYVSYVLPTALGLRAFGRSWTRMGPWHLGKWFRPAGAISVVGCLALILIGLQPPNQKAGAVLVGMSLLLIVAWYGLARHSFPGPPIANLLADPRRAPSTDEGRKEPGRDG
ncbi:MAG: amino acid permease [Planctomycetes bacterium]|nr:amino acid permease [Planctomycetota bacterium]